MTDLPDIRLRHPFRTTPLTGDFVGWGRPALSVILALVLPAFLSLHLILAGAPVLSGPPKDGSGYTLADHLGLVIGLLAVSPVVSWVMLPFAVPTLRAAAMLGYAGWATSMGTGLILGLPLVHFMLNGDLTTEENAIPLQVAAAICVLSLVVWALFWGLMVLKQKRMRRAAS